MKEKEITKKSKSRMNQATLTIDLLLERFEILKSLGIKDAKVVNEMEKYNMNLCSVPKIRIILYNIVESFGFSKPF